MLRFDIPQVWSNVVRMEALVTSLVCVLALLVSPWFMALLVLQGAVRGFAGHHRCPAHLAWKALLLQADLAGRQEDAGAKMFANKLLFLASAVSMALFLAGSSLWIVPCSVLIAFSTAEWALSFCAACWAYGVWYRRFPPTGA